MATTLENDNKPPPPPRESMAAAVTLEQPELEGEREEATTLEPPATLSPELEPAPASVEATPSTVAAPPSAVRKLPRRPRIRASYYYDQNDQLNLELTLMDERRDLIYRTTLQPEDGGALARNFEALVAIAMRAAAKAGVFGKALGNDEPPPSENQ